MRTKIRIPFYFLGLLFSLLLSCEDKPDFIGSDLLPSGDSFVVFFDSMDVIHGFTQGNDSIPSGFKAEYLVGNITDPFFGRSKAEIVTTITSSINSRGFGENATADSVILYLAIGEQIGEGSLPLHLEVYEYTEFVRYDSTYYSNMDISGLYRDTEIGSASLASGDTVLKIFIQDTVFINKFLTAHDSNLRFTENLQYLMNGLYLKTDDAVDEGSILNIDFDDAQTYLYFFYKNDTVTTVQNQYFSFESTYNRRINLFNHDRAGYPIEEYILNGSENDSLIFVQSMAGVTSVISFPGLTHWIDSMPIAINEARLIFSMADTVPTLQKRKYFPEALSIYSIREDGTYSISYDNLLDVGSFGGKYDSDTKTYSFTIKAQLQSILAGSLKNLNMVIIPNSTSSTVSRGVLNGWNKDPQKRIRLEITYTKL